MKQDPPDTRDTNTTEPPLWSIGLAMLVILFAPIVLYSLAPTGPIREGDTIFANGQQRVQFSTPIASRASRAAQPDNTCLLDPDSPLIVLRIPSSEAADLLIAEVQGSPAAEWPFCPVHAEVLVTGHQVFQKPAASGTVRDTLVKWFGR